MKLPIQSAPVYRYNACTPGYSSIEEGINPAVSWGKLAKCAIQCGAGTKHVLCLTQCGTNKNCLDMCFSRQRLTKLSMKQTQCLANC